MTRKSNRNERKNAQKKKNKRTTKETVLKLVPAANPEEYENMIRALQAKPHAALRLFEEGVPTPDAWNELKARVLVGKELAKVWETNTELERTLEDGRLAVVAIADRHHATGTLRASPMEINLISEALAVVDAMQEQMDDKELLVSYRNALKVINGRN